MRTIGEGGAFLARTLLDTRGILYSLEDVHVIFSDFGRRVLLFVRNAPGYASKPRKSRSPFTVSQMREMFDRLSVLRSSRIRDDVPTLMTISLPLPLAPSAERLEVLDPFFMALVGWLDARIGRIQGKFRRFASKWEGVSASITSRGPRRAAVGLQLVNRTDQHPVPAHHSLRHYLRRDDTCQVSSMRPKRSWVMCPWSRGPSIARFAGRAAGGSASQMRRPPNGLSICSR